MDDTYISGEKSIEQRDIAVTGVDFYATIENLPVIKKMYELARWKVFDLYDVGTAVLFYFVEALRSIHTGLLPRYLTWLVAGLLILMWVLLH